MTITRFEYTEQLAVITVLLLGFVSKEGNDYAWTDPDGWAITTYLLAEFSWWCVFTGLIGQITTMYVAMRGYEERGVKIKIYTTSTTILVATGCLFYVIESFLDDYIDAHKLGLMDWKDDNLMFWVTGGPDILFIVTIPLYILHLARAKEGIAVNATNNSKELASIAYQPLSLSR